MKILHIPIDIRCRFLYTLDYDDIDSDSSSDRSNNSDSLQRHVNKALVGYSKDPQKLSIDPGELRLSQSKARGRKMAEQRTIKLTRSGIEAFMCVWPCSNLNRVQKIVAEFDANDNLTDLMSYPYGAIDQADMNAVNAILNDMKRGILGTRVSPLAA